MSVNSAEDGRLTAGSTGLSTNNSQDDHNTFAYTLNVAPLTGPARYNVYRLTFKDPNDNENTALALVSEDRPHQDQGILYRCVLMLFRTGIRYERCLDYKFQEEKEFESQRFMFRMHKSALHDFEAIVERTALPHDPTVPGYWNIQGMYLRRPHDWVSDILRGTRAARLGG